MNFSRIFQKAFFLGLGATGTVGRGEIIFDVEIDPIPLVEFTILLPRGTEVTQSGQENIVPLLNHFLNIGPMGMEKEEFFGQLADFGATFSVSASPLQTVISLSFPWDKSKNYEPLRALLETAWMQPRFNERELNLAKIDLKSNTKAVLDNDAALSSQFLTRWLNVNIFGIPNFSLDSIDSTKLSDVRAHFENYIRKSPQAWAGYVGPTEAVEWAQSLVRSLLKNSGEIRVGKAKAELEGVHEFGFNKNFLGKKLFFAIDKKGQNQTVSQFLAVSDSKLDNSKELDFWFGRHVFTDSGLGSFFGDELRNKRGLAYSVGGARAIVFDRMALNVFFNPQRSRQDEALEVFSQSLKAAFETGSAVADLPKADWERQFKSFKYGRVLGRSTSSGRLGERMSVATGASTLEFVESPHEKWRVDRARIRSLFGGLWKNSVQLVVVVGDSSEIQSLHAKYFPGYEFKVIPYKNVIETRTYLP